METKNKFIPALMQEAIDAVKPLWVEGVNPKNKKKLYRFPKGMREATTILMYRDMLLSLPETNHEKKLLLSNKYFQHIFMVGYSIEKFDITISSGVKGQMFILKRPDGRLDLRFIDISAPVPFAENTGYEFVMETNKKTFIICFCKGRWGFTTKHFTFNPVKYRNKYADWV